MKSVNNLSVLTKSAYYPAAIMAIFERTPQNRTIVDDTEKLVCTVENALNINKHTEYILRVQRGPNKENKWNVSRRFRDFAALHSSIQQANMELKLPPKKLIGNMQPSFIAERQIALQEYINEVLKHEILALSLPVRSFLDPSNYPLSLAEQALQTISIALRGDGRYELKGPSGEIGWRIRKHYFLVTDVETRTNCLLSWQSYGPDKHLCNKDLQTAFKSLQNMSHPFIDQPLAIHTLETGSYTVRNIYEKGTVRDMLYGTKYSKNYLVKYSNPKVRRPFTAGQIAHYGYQILQALQFLHEHGLPHGHIHPSNIAIVNQKVRLLDTENYLIGVPCVYRPHTLELRKSSSSETIDVYCFGRTVYEMAFAEPLKSYYCDTYPTQICEELEQVLWTCLSPQSCKHGGLTLARLLYSPFFTRSVLHGISTPEDVRTHLRLSEEVKKEVDKAVAGSEARLKSEQKLVRNARREVRIQEILSSEKELKRHQRKAKKRESVSASTSSLAGWDAAASTSSASSPTPPAPETNGTGSHTPPAAPAPRSALLDAICSFDKKRLAHIDAS